MGVELNQEERFIAYKLLEKEWLKRPLTDPEAALYKRLADVKIPGVKRPEKPPIGIMPRDIWDGKCKEQRLKDLLTAMNRYANDGIEIPKEWHAEYLDLTKDLKLYTKETFWMDQN